MSLNQPTTLEAHVRIGTLTETQRHEILADECRRRLLEILGDDRSSMPLEELASEIAAQEADREPLPQTTVEDIAIRLHHVHLPMLEKFGVLSYDESECRVDTNPVTAIPN